MAIPMVSNVAGVPSVAKNLQAIPRGYSQSQLGILNQLGPMGLSGIQQATNIEPILQRARTQFQTQTIPSIAERFTSLGGQRSSAFQGALGQAGAGLEESLASLGAQQQQSLLPLYMQLLNLGLQPQYDIGEMQRQPSGLTSILGGLGQGLGSIAPLLLPLLLGGSTGGLGGLGALGSLGLLGRQ